MIDYIQQREDGMNGMQGSPGSPQLLLAAFGPFWVSGWALHEIIDKHPAQQQACSHSAPLQFGSAGGLW